MKNLILINGTMGAGKTAVSQELQKLLPDNVFLDGDWCWMMSPFTVTQETKEMVQQNIAFLLNQFLACSAFQNIIFCWVMQEQSIVDEVVSKLDTQNCRVYPFTLMCTKEALLRHLEDDIRSGIRTPDVIARSLARLPGYESQHSIKIDVSDITAAQAAEKIRQQLPND